jgi:hypothetical protein
MGNDNDGDEETPQPETLSQLFDNMSNDFWQSNLVASPLKVLKRPRATIEVFYGFPCVFRGVVPLHLTR